MPRRYYEYIASYQTLNQIATVGAFLLGIPLFVTLGYLIAGNLGPVVHATRGMDSLSSAYSDTPIEHNFHGQPTVSGTPDTPVEPVKRPRL